MGHMHITGISPAGGRLLSRIQEWDETQDAADYAQELQNGYRRASELRNARKCLESLGAQAKGKKIGENIYRFWTVDTGTDIPEPIWTPHTPRWKRRIKDWKERNVKRIEPLPQPVGHEEGFIVWFSPNSISDARMQRSIDSVLDEISTERCKVRIPKIIHDSVLIVMEDFTPYVPLSHFKDYMVDRGTEDGLKATYDSWFESMYFQNHKNPKKPIEKRAVAMYGEELTFRPSAQHSRESCLPDLKREYSEFCNNAKQYTVTGMETRFDRKRVLFESFFAPHRVYAKAYGGNCFELVAPCLHGLTPP